MDQESTFDYIVIGVGSPKRLTADGKYVVLVVEAEPKSRPWSRIPDGFSCLIDHPVAKLCFTSEPDEGAGQRRFFVPRGKLAGGTSAINGMIFTRG